MTNVKTIRIWSFAKFQAFLIAQIGLIAGIVYSFGGAVYDILITGSVNLGIALAFLALIGMPIIFAVFGFILGLIEAVLYNTQSRWISGLKIDFIP